MAERLGEGLQNPLRGFESHSVLHLRHCGRSLAGRAPPCQGGGREFESHRPLHFGTDTRANLCWHATCSPPRANLSIKKILFFVRLPLT